MSSLPHSQYFETRLGCYDELVNSPHLQQLSWSSFMAKIQALGGKELEYRRKESERLLRENGVTYTVYDDKAQFSRSWKLDPIPLLIGNGEWQVIERGLKQRAHLIDLILKDIYGEQKLLTRNVIPAQLIFAHRGFLVPCVGSMSTDSSQVALHAANLARGPNGNMWVLNDHFQAPSGIGYSFENRSVIGRVMADLFQGLPVQRLNDFFSSLQNSLSEAAPYNKSEPRIVVLTPGPFNETYFEHAYLASQLGFTLVQGDDLTVRDKKVWLRSLSGLEQVDVILRRLDDNYCDPLELMGLSKLGVAGLLQSVRSGNVSIINPLGSGVLENPGLFAFFPALCRYFLNEDLLLPSVASWWCGQEKECQFVLKNIENLVIKNINRGRHHQTIFGHLLSKNEREELIARIKFKPHLFVGQEQISFSTVPSLVDGEVEPRNSVIRCYTIVNSKGFQVMPGGLTRIALQKDQFAISNQFGAISKDTWVLGEEDKVNTSLKLGKLNVLVAPKLEPLTSRAADNLFWVGRNFERISATARLLRTIILKQTEIQNNFDSDSQSCIKILLTALTHQTASYPGFLQINIASRLELDKEIRSLFRDAHRTGTLANNIQIFFQTALNVRDLWSQDTWHCIDSIHDFWHNQVIQTQYDSTHPQWLRYLVELNTRLAAFSGLTSESMTRESAWQMLQAGRKLERALAISSLLRSTMVPKMPDNILYPVLEAVLMTTDSFTIYQRRYRSAPRIAMLLNLLLSDFNHPYSLLFQIKYLNDVIEDLPGQHQHNQISREHALILKAFTDLRLLDINDLLSNGKSAIYTDLDNFLANLTQQLFDLSKYITQKYFIHVATEQPWVIQRSEDRM